MHLIQELMNIWPNADVLPPGQVWVIEVETVELLPVGRDDLFCVFILRTLRARMTSSISEV